MFPACIIFRHSLSWGFGLLLGAVGLRAQITESPDTVAPGHFLIEMDALSLTFNKDGGSKDTDANVASTLLTTGLGANWDFQIGAELFRSQKHSQGDFTERHRGVGDVYVRTKWRIISDAGTGGALAVMPYVKIPTNSGGVGNKSLEGGLIVPWTIALPAGITLQAMAELDYLRNDSDSGYVTALFTSAALSRQLTQTYGLYAEFTAGKATGGTPWSDTLGGGMTVAVTGHVWWDFAVYRGLSRSAADWNPVIRFNWAF